MKKSKFVFLILHYLTFDDTVKCVDSIKEKCIDYNYEILNTNMMIVCVFFPMEKR